MKLHCAIICAINQLKINNTTIASNRNNVCHSQRFFVTETPQGDNSNNEKNQNEGGVKAKPIKKLVA